MNLKGIVKLVAYPILIAWIANIVFARVLHTGAVAVALSAAVGVLAFVFLIKRYFQRDHSDSNFDLDID